MVVSFEGDTESGEAVLDFMGVGSSLVLAFVTDPAIDLDIVR